MAAPPESDRLAIGGFEPVHRVAQSYLGTLWIALQKAVGESEQLALLRRVHLPDGTPSEARQAIAAAGRDAMELDLPHVLRVLNVLEEGDQLAVVYEHAEAEPLRSLQSWANLRCLSFPVGVSLRIVCDLLAGLDALHGTVASTSARPVFGGLSPDSVLVSRTGKTLLADPLVASSASLLEGVGFNTAKLAYAAPEQVHAVSALTPQADLFTCAAMLWELLATRRLLAGSRAAIERKLLEHSLPNLNANLRGQMRVNPPLVDVVEEALAADPGKRPTSAARMAERLGQCGYELASHEEVAEFVGKLSGQRFDRRTAAVRSKSSPQLQLDAPLEWPLELPGLGAVPRRAPGRSTDTARIVPMPGDPKRSLTPAPKPVREAAPAMPARPAAPATPAREPAPATPARPAAPPTPATPAREAPPAPAREAPPAPARPQQPLAPARVAPRNATMNGLGVPAHPALAPTLPFVNMTPDPSSARGPIRELNPPLDGKTPRGHTLLEAQAAASKNTNDWQPFGAASRAPFQAASTHPAPQASPPSQAPGMAAPALSSASTPPASSVPISVQPAAPAAHANAFARLAAAAPRSGFRFRAPRWALLTVLAAGLGLASAVAVGLITRWAKPGSAATMRAGAAAAAAPPEAASPAAPPAPESAAESAAPASVTRAAPAPAIAPTPAAPAPPAATPSAPAASASANDASPTLSDARLAELFALEERSDVPSCAERLSDGNARYSGKDHEQSRAQLLAARREMMRGRDEQAHFFLCGSTAHDPSNSAAQLALAELALQLGDPEEAKAIAEAALERAPRERELAETLGDSLALLGDVTGARRTWLATLPEPDDPEQARRLGNSYRLMGDRALKGSSFARARNYYRRALILSEGSFAASVGLSDALLWLKHARAALVWAERAAREFPKDSRVQLLYGDALYHNDEPERAKAAWQAALDAQPNLRAAARRLARGKP